MMILTTYVCMTTYLFAYLGILDGWLLHHSQRCVLPDQ